MATIVETYEENTRVMKQNSEMLQEILRQVKLLSAHLVDLVDQKTFRTLAQTREVARKSRLKGNGRLRLTELEQELQRVLQQGNFTMFGPFNFASDLIRSHVLILHPFLLQSSKMIETISNLHFASSFNSLNDFLYGKSYIFGIKLSKDDVKVYVAILKNPGDTFLNISKWYNVVSSQLVISFPGKAVDVGFGDKVALDELFKANATDDNDDMDLFRMKLCRKRDISEEKFSNVFLWYGPKESHFVVELTYNYGITSYDIRTGSWHFATVTQIVYNMVEEVHAKDGNITRECGPVKVAGSLHVSSRQISKLADYLNFEDKVLTLGGGSVMNQHQQRDKLLRKLQVGNEAYERDTPASTQYLDEDKSLILKIVENQNSGKLSECAENQARLQRNLVYLAAVADSRPQPSTRHAQFQSNGIRQLGGGHYMQHQQAQQMMQQSLKAARSSMLYAEQPFSALQQQQALHGQFGMSSGGSTSLHMLQTESSTASG
ncbi:hypothetical protein V6N12_046922 [Hibiscus sabdariffa]|uniref:SS18 N-terminal domain-containing protein n=1 Tax=Hibiscus sabdariffa TaxID=183260 RepID=A0ABR2BE05_9ROSI